MTDVGVVVIGRNEGERLVLCLRSVSGAAALVYVDSGSTDGSADRARELGADVLALDMRRPFTAARARNAGFERLMELAPSVRWVQFVDGDCEVRDRWIERGAAALAGDDARSAVCGRLRERHPEQSVFNRVCDIGWDYPLGDIAACGGVAMYRADRYRAVGGFDDALIAGEEFDLCNRLRAAGGRIERLDAEMAWHDVGLTRFGQWWKRTVRAGYSYAEGWHRHAGAAAAGFRRSAHRALFWGLAVPATVVACGLCAIAWPRAALVAAAVLVLPLAQAARLTVANVRRGRTLADAAAFGVFLVLAKLPEAQGVLRFGRTRLFRGRAGIIEYR